MRSGAFTTTRRMAVVAAALAVLPAAADAQTRENNRAVHALLSAVDLGEIQQSMLAHERAANPEVHQFASMMIAEHGNALHGREARLGQENQGILGQGMSMEQYRAAGQGPLPPAYGPGNGGNASGGSVPEGQKATSAARASDGAGVGELPPAYGPGNGQVQTENTQGGGTHAGHGNMAAAQQTREGAAAQANIPQSGGFGLVVRRGGGGFFVNGVIARWRGAAISLRDLTSTQLRANEGSLVLRNILVAENGAMFQPGATNFALDSAANEIRGTTSATSALFSAFPATTSVDTRGNAFDWRPATASAAAQGGTGAFSGALAAKGGTFVTGTAYRGAVAVDGPRWWEGWTSYVQR